MEIKQQILNEIIAADKIVICRHQRPDGDCIGSSLGLRDMLRTSFPNKKIYSVGNEKSAYLQFMNTEDENLEEYYNGALVIVVDTANKARISTNLEYLSKATKVIKIDHHIPVEHYGDINYVLEEEPACACIITDFLLSFPEQLKITSEGTKCLFIGMATDTGNFQYRGVTSKTFMLASELLKYDLDLENIYMYLRIKDANALKLEGYLAKNFKITENGVAYISFSLKTQEKYQVSTEEASNMVNRLSAIRGSLIWVAFIEQPNHEIRVRLRSRLVEINEIASRYRGGGHANTSGATIFTLKEKKSLLNEADQLLKEFKEKHKEAF